jgi:hypothetical protein
MGWFHVCFGDAREILPVDRRDDVAGVQLAHPDQAEAGQIGFPVH